MDPRVRAVRSSPWPLMPMPGQNTKAIVNAAAQAKRIGSTHSHRARPPPKNTAAWFRWFDVAHMSYRVRLEYTVRYYDRKAVSSQHSGKRASGPVTQCETAP